jgi:hypothetical protein
MIAWLQLACDPPVITTVFPEALNEPSKVCPCKRGVMGNPGRLKPPSTPAGSGNLCPLWEYMRAFDGRASSLKRREKQ